MERKLATIQKIENLEPIEGADQIEKATIKGWTVVVKKGEFSIGDLVVYCEIDSVMPDRTEFEFLRPKGFRIKTIKLRNTVSQGICFPIEILKGHIENPVNMPLDTIINDRWIGQDLTEVLGITKYEKPIPAELQGVAKGGFPSHSIKTDEERLQNLKGDYPTYKLKKWIATEKLDGCLDEKTLLETEEGIKTIKEICESKYSGKVKTFNLVTQKEEFRKILGHYIKESTNHQWFEIELENGIKIKITGNHEVWLPKLLCWRRVDELTGGEEFLLKK